MGRAFREGVSQKKKVTMRTKARSWKPLADLQGLSGRTKVIGSDMGPLVEVPAMLRIENEKWIFERINQETLTHLTHRLVIHESEGPRTLGATLDLDTAMQVAQGMARTEGSVVLIEPLR
ncbi:MAG: hypothetical protein GWP21_02695 [Euryarchaeota archaeon]|nr:hypothetical protein [Euryarchaeota archaeon]MBT7244531.1 hypothetical protein [Euryarchaeota archaeon]NCF96805.1 hypothetical protein [Euryarchaeota archaeon]